jgi:hypothetical protein
MLVDSSHFRPQPNIQSTKRCILLLALQTVKGENVEHRDYICVLSIATEKKVQAFVECRSSRLNFSEVAVCIKLVSYWWSDCLCNGGPNICHLKLTFE